VRVRRLNETDWHAGRSINLSVTGILLETGNRYRVGERVEVEIDFPVQPNSKTIIRGAGLVVREDRHLAALGAAIQFDVSIDTGAPLGVRSEPNRSPTD
jgi:hypothetical protein